ncbi:MAG: class I SAM-dependent methyltransferase [Candidatus Saccharimonadales bacterium]
MFTQELKLNCLFGMIFDMTTDPNTIRGYNENAENYHKHVSDPNDSIFHAYYEKPAIRAELPSLDGLEVISIGCGSGVDAKWLADHGAKRVVGVDISSGLLNIATKNFPDIEFIEMNMEELAFSDESFDLAYSSLAIHYVDDWTPSLKEAKRILRSGGQYIFSVGHPIDSAMEYETNGEIKYVRLGRKINQLTQQRTIYGDYLAKDGNGTKLVGGVLGSFEVKVYHRTFSKMIEQIVASGFTIERVIEPQPTEKMHDINPGMADQLTRIPSFMIWVLTKPAA